MKHIVWSLFDSGKGAYSRNLEKYSEFENYSIGIDRENKSNHHLNIDLADMTAFWGESKLYCELDKLPKPDIILASPPCESWSNASGMEHGNACWRSVRDNLLFQNSGVESDFLVRDCYSCTERGYIFSKSFLNRINGELTIFNTIEIIKKYNPKVYIIENPAYGRIWKYIDEILNFKIEYKNLAYYCNYGTDYKKPTFFSGNILLNLNHKKPNRKLKSMLEVTYRPYNLVSDIPDKLVCEIIEQILKNGKLQSKHI